MLARFERSGTQTFCVIVAVAFVTSLGGTYWDAGWHTVRGRDSFLSAPHLALYAGITLLGGLFVLRAAAVVKTSGARAVFSHPGLALGVAGAAVTLGAGPVDDAWHRAFGRDAVIWSPPHILGVVGTLAIAAAVALEVRDGERSVRRFFAPVAGAALIATSLIPVLEYDLDVPQFDGVFYLPVLCAGAAFAFSLIRRIDDRRFATTSAALLYTAVMGVLGLVVAIWNYPAPLLPLLVPAALAADLPWVRARPIAMRAAAICVLIFAAYAPVLDLLGTRTTLDGKDIAVGLFLAWLGATATSAVALQESRVWMRAAPVAAVLLVAGAAVGAPTPALAHDPGQGPVVGTAALKARADGRTAHFSADFSAMHACDSTQPVRLEARRAGRTLRAPLSRSGRCSAAGSIDLPDSGRWFLYAELVRNHQPLETWLPLQLGGSAWAADSERRVYSPRRHATSSLKVVAGVVVYLLLFAVMAGIGRSFAKIEPRQTSAA